MSQTRESVLSMLVLLTFVQLPITGEIHSKEAFFGFFLVGYLGCPERFVPFKCNVPPLLHRVRFVLH